MKKITKLRGGNLTSQKSLSEVRMSMVRIYCSMVISGNKDRVILKYLISFILKEIQTILLVMALSTIT